MLRARERAAAAVTLTSPVVRAGGRAAELADGLAAGLAEPRGRPAAGVWPWFAVASRAVAAAMIRTTRAATSAIQRPLRGLWLCAGAEQGAVGRRVAGQCRCFGRLSLARTGWC